MARGGTPYARSLRYTMLKTRGAAPCAGGETSLAETVKTTVKTVNPTKDNEI